MANCEHCFCQTVFINGIKHKKCCMCGTVIAIHFLGNPYFIYCIDSGLKNINDFTTNNSHTNISDDSDNPQN